MIDAKIKMCVPANKRMEVLQTIKTMLGIIRNESGCISCNCCVDAEDEFIIIFTQEWDTKDNLAAHLRSDQFTVLLGAMKLLSIEPEIRINTIAATSGAEAITKARAELKRDIPWLDKRAITLPTDQ